jgi:hypothetical protein
MIMLRLLFAVIGVFVASCCSGEGGGGGEGRSGEGEQRLARALAVADSADDALAQAGARVDALGAENARKRERLRVVARRMVAQMAHALHPGNPPKWLAASLAAETWPAVHAAGSARPHDLLRGDGARLLQPFDVFPDDWGPMRIFLNGQQYIDLYIPWAMRIAAEEGDADWFTAEIARQAAVEEILFNARMVILDGLFAAGMGPIFMAAFAVAVIGASFAHLFDNNNARVETDCSPDHGFDAPLLYFLGGVEYDMKTGANMSTPGPFLQMPPAPDRFNSVEHTVSHVVSKEGLFEWICGDKKTSVNFGTGDDHFPDNTLVTFQITRHPCANVVYSMLDIRYVCKVDIQVSHWAELKPAPTPAPTPMPTPAPTTSAPTADFHPECLSSLPGVDGEDLEASHNLCKDHYNWLTQYWNTTLGPFAGDPNVYEKAGVDGSPCSIVNYLSNRTKEEKDDTWCLCQCPQ